MCKECTEKCTSTCNDESTDDTYTKELSRGGLVIPAKIVTDFVSKAFAILDFCDEKIKNSSLIEREGAQLALQYNDIDHNLFLCKNHANEIYFFNKIIINIFFNNYRKEKNGQIRKDQVHTLKKSQLSKKWWTCNKLQHNLKMCYWSFYFFNFIIIPLILIRTRYYVVIDSTQKGLAQQPFWMMRFDHILS